MKRKVVWNNKGAFNFLGFCLHAEISPTLLLYRDPRRGMLAVPFKNSDEFSQAGMPTNRRFDLIEE